MAEIFDFYQLCNDYPRQSDNNRYQCTPANRRQAQRTKPTQAAVCVSAAVQRNKRETNKNSDMTFELIKDYIAEGETESAIQNLLKMAKDKYLEYQNDITLLAGKFNNWKREKILGIGDNEQKEWNKINYSILQLISLIEFENQKKPDSELTGYILVRYWSNKKMKDDYTINDNENENLIDVGEINKGNKYIIKYTYGANLRAYLPPKEGYSNRTIKDTTLICNLKQGTNVEIIEPVYQFSENDYWAKVKVIT